MKLGLAIVCLSICASVSSIACKQIAIGNSEAESNKTQNSQAGVNYNALGGILQKAGISGEHGAQLKKMVQENGAHIKAKMEEGKVKLLELRDATPEKRIELGMGVFRVFTNMYIPLVAPIVAGVTGVAVNVLIAKTQPVVEEWLKNDIEQPMRNIFIRNQSPKVNQSALPKESFKEVLASLEINSDESSFAGMYSPSTMALGDDVGPAADSYQAEVQKAIPNWGTISGICIGIMAILACFWACPAAIGGVAVAGTAGAAALGASIGVSWVCLVAVFRCMLMAAGKL